MQPLLDARVKLRARHRFDFKYQGLVRITSRLRCPGTRAAEASRLNDDDNLAHFIISRSRPLPKFHEPRFSEPPPEGGLDLVTNRKGAI